MKAAWATKRGPGEPGFQAQVCQPLGLLRAERLDGCMAGRELSRGSACLSSSRSCACLRVHVKMLSTGPVLLSPALVRGRPTDPWAWMTSQLDE